MSSPPSPTSASPSDAPAERAAKRTKIKVEEEEMIFERELYAHAGYEHNNDPLPCDHGAALYLKCEARDNDVETETSTEPASRQKRKAPNAFAPPFKIPKRKSVVTTKTTKDYRVPAKMTRGDLDDLKALKSRHQSVVSASTSDRFMAEKVSRVYEQIHKMALFSFVNTNYINEAKVLDVLERIAASNDSSSSPFHYAWFIRADARALFDRWSRNDNDPYLLRGINANATETQDGKKNRTYSADKNFTFAVSCNYFGAGKLQNGQWFPLQICAKRDGAHGEVEAGIHGQTKKGAYSVVLSSKDYANIDKGEVIEYCSTAGRSEKDSTGTTLMKLSLEKGTPVRVLRSHHLPATNEWRPAAGLRYDGLYTVTAVEVLDMATAMHRFTLVRVDGQTPIRCKGVYARPSVQEVEKWREMRGLMG